MSGYNRKKMAGCVLLFLSLALFVTGCGAKTEAGEEERLKVAASIFPYYDFARQIGGDRIQLSLVVPAGMDSHSFEPTPADMRTIQEADILLCNGGEMENWLEKVLDSLDEPDLLTVTMMDYVDAVEEELVEGMEAGHEEGHGHEHELDEHIWTSPRNAIEFARIIGETFAEADPENEMFYRDRAALYIKELEKLDMEFEDMVSESRGKLIVVADKFPFRYLAEDYGLEYRAAFSGCSTDSEPSAKTIAYLIDLVKERNIPAVFYLELKTPRVAEIISEETGAEALLLHSCHNLTRRELEDGVTYLELMRNNVENLRKGLN